MNAPVPPIVPKVIGATSDQETYLDELQRLGRCGTNARRIFVPELQSIGIGSVREAYIMDAVAERQLPVVSFKVPHVSDMLAGKYDSWFLNARNFLNSFGVQTTATFWHEPYKDLDPADFRECSRRFAGLMQGCNIAVGPILNGWLLDTPANTVQFEQFFDYELLTTWDFVAVDTYQTGTNEKPGAKMPGRAVPLLVDLLAGWGFPFMPVGVGEYGGLTADGVAQAGETFLSTPNLWFALVWQGVAKSTGIDWWMDGDKLAAFQATKADARALQGTGCEA